ncbi:hypothetical protein [Halegenticoccus tardaugens]|uniref:hypothetical protein n=1 Tax=Halegenticoccus tardaugens TaxID=2071624 RepID=UPI00100BD9ED|nr:hypothetical protein [Halegenticoccus tardaugens]
MARSRGDPRVLLTMNLALSSAFAAVVVWGLSFIDVVPFTLERVAVLAALLFVVTHLVTR